MLSRVTYTLREMWASLSRNLTLTVAAIITATVSLFLLGMTLLIQRAFDNQLQLWTGGIEMIVYMEPDASADQILYVQTALEQQPALIKSVDSCDKQCSFDRVQELFAGDPDYLSRFSLNIAPHHFRVVPVDQDNSAQLKQIGDQIDDLPKVRAVQFPGDVIDILSQLKGFVGVRTLVMSVLLLLASALLIWNTIRTAMFARRREIEVMKLVGATDWFIRLPFMLEGMLQGLVGGALASSLLWFVNSNWTSGVRDFPAQSGLEGFVVAGTPTGVMLAMLAVGALVGAIGSATAASKFLDV